jgi:hypothetical protein
MRCKCCDVEIEAGEFCCADCFYAYTAREFEADRLKRIESE